jgi:hypothetical protein
MVLLKIFELARASSTDFFINISPLLTLSKFKIIRWWSNKVKYFILAILSFFYKARVFIFSIFKFYLSIYLSLLGS